MGYQSKYSRSSRPGGLGICIVVLVLAVTLTAAILGMEPGEQPGHRDTISFSGPADSQPPVICGVRDILIYAGDTPHYRSGVTVTDETDPSPSLEIDTSAVDLTTPGTYRLGYFARDAAGNTAKAIVQVTVLPATENHVTMDAVWQEADALLETIITEQMDPRQQVRAIYRWARKNMSYSGHSDREDRYQTAYTVLREQTGDCYGYFAVTKLLFERLGIPNIDVVKVKNSDSDSQHFWSLVSVDGGESYYHFDATPRVGEGDDFCLVTDEFLDDYSRKHKFSHNRDTSLYPATPEEAP